MRAPRRPPVAPHPRSDAPLAHEQRLWPGQRQPRPSGPTAAAAPAAPDPPAASRVPTVWMPCAAPAPSACTPPRSRGRSLGCCGAPVACLCSWAQHWKHLVPVSGCALGILPRSSQVFPGSRQLPPGSSSAHGPAPAPGGWASLASWAALPAPHLRQCPSIVECAPQQPMPAAGHRQVHRPTGI